MLFVPGLAVVMGGDQEHRGKNAASWEMIVWKHKQKCAHKQEARRSTSFGLKKKKKE